jgi:hypothetical protein
MVSVVGMVGLLNWNVHFTEHLITYTVGPSLERMQNMKNDMEMMYLQQSSEAQVQVYAGFSG